MERDSFVFYRSFYDSVKDLENEDFAECMRFLCEYALNGCELQGSMLAEVVLKMAKPQIDANNQRRANGTKGGRPKGSGFEGENQKQVRFSDEKPNVYVNEDVNGNGNEDENVNGNVNVNGDRNGNGNRGADAPAGQDKPAKARTFKPPSLAEVQEYCAERGNRVDAEHFCDFYASKGWMVGKNKMKDWKAAVRNWERQDAERAEGQTGVHRQGASKQSGGNDFLRMLAEYEEGER